MSISYAEPKSKEELQNLQNFAESVVTKYQELLQLQHWKINVQVISAAKYAKKHGVLFEGSTNGCTDIYQTTRKANIYIKDNLTSLKFITCIIHEMVHIPVNNMYVSGLTFIEKIEDNELRESLLKRWPWELEESVSKITDGFLKLEESLDL